MELSIPLCCLIFQSLCPTKIFTQEEMYGPLLLRQKKQHSTRETGRQYYAEHDYLDRAHLEVYSARLVCLRKLLRVQLIIQVVAITML